PSQIQQSPDRSTCRQNRSAIGCGARPRGTTSVYLVVDGDEDGLETVILPRAHHACLTSGMLTDAACHFCRTGEHSWVVTDLSEHCKCCGLIRERFRTAKQRARPAAPTPAPNTNGRPHAKPWQRAK